MVEIDKSSIAEPSIIIGVKKEELTMIRKEGSIDIGAYRIKLVKSRRTNK